VVEPFELADAVVREAVDGNRIHVAWSREVEIREGARVVVQCAREQDAGAARRPVPAAESGQGLLRLGIALFDGSSVEHSSRTCVVDLVEDCVPHRVAVHEDDA
jgi:hypothetical protein